jgi:hypothetical protein
MIPDDDTYEAAPLPEDSLCELMAEVRELVSACNTAHDDVRPLLIEGIKLLLTEAKLRVHPPQVGNA